MKMADKTPDACPVDHEAREAWLSQARAAQASKAQSSSPQTCPVDHAPKPKSWSESLSSYLPWSSSPQQPTQLPPGHPSLDTGRVVSSIPRSTSNPDACPVEHGASANAEMDSGSDADTGNWVYPSERMFFDAMKRKGYDARETDMKTVVPIHNAVNERAWAQIKQWEAPYLADNRYSYASQPAKTNR